MACKAISQGRPFLGAALEAGLAAAWEAGRLLAAAIMEANALRPVPGDAACMHLP